MPAFERQLMVIQLPIIISIVIMCFQAIKLIDKEAFKWIAYGWITNLIYITFYFLATGKPDDILQFSSRINSDDLSSISTIADGLSSLFFVFAFKRALDRLGFVRFGSIQFFWWILAISVGVIIKVVSLYSTNSQSLLSVASAPTVFCDTLALILLGRFFHHYTEQFPKASVLHLSTYLYALIQLLALFNDQKETDFQKVVYMAGFSIGLVCKLAILIGLAILLIQHVKQLSRVESEAESNLLYGQRMENILGRTFHEVNPPLLEIESVLSDLLAEDAREREILINKRVKRDLERMEGALYRAKTILSASIKLYLNGVGRVSSASSEDLPLLVEEDVDVHNLNTLIEIAIMNFKSKFLKDFGLNNDNVIFHKEYGKNCNIYCNSVQLVQVFFNLFKNSLEAAEEGKICNIYVKTKNIKFHPDGSKSNNESFFTRRVRVEITDDGPGIEKEDLPRIFEQGYSTKGTDKKIKGFGLDIVKTYTEMNNGFISVVTNTAAQTNHGDIAIRPGTTFLFDFSKS